MKNSLFLISQFAIYSISAIILISCDGKKEKSDDEPEIETYVHDDIEDEELIEVHKKIPGQPEISINVAKRYDKEGNLIRFDSTYSSYYSSNEQNSLLMDSLITEFHPYYFEHYPPLFKKRMDELFFGDTMLHTDFFHDDFFSRRYSLNIAYFNDLMLEMDSIKNAFYKRKSEFIHDNQ